MAALCDPHEYVDDDISILAHFGDEYDKYDGAVVQPIFMNSLHVTPKDEMDRQSERPFVYGRLSNPTVDLLERKVAALERGEKALAFASGMATISSSIMVNVKAGDHIICVDTVYGPTRGFIDSELVSKFGLTVTYIEGTDVEEFERAATDRTSVIYLESPSSMVFKLQDLAAVAAFAKPRGIVTIIDNTWATPLYQKPLMMGVDISVHTMSKYIGGHSDIIAGVAVGSQDMMKKLARVRELYGGILQPMEAWLAIRGLRTLAVRVKAHEAACLELAQRLERHNAVARVMHPGLESFPQYELARRQMTGTTSPFSFELATDNKGAREFVARLRWFNMGPSWGGFESMVVPPHGTSTLVRIHVGLENVEVLWDDLKASLDLVGER